MDTSGNKTRHFSVAEVLSPDIIQSNRYGGSGVLVLLISQKRFSLRNSVLCDSKLPFQLKC